MQTGSSHFHHRITKMPTLWKHEKSNEILEHNGKGAAQAAVKAGCTQGEALLLDFATRRISLFKYIVEVSLPRRVRKDLVVLKASAGKE